MLINEFAQWAVILLLGIIVLGLVRQLGIFLTPRRDLVLDRGPAIGSDLPASLFDEMGAQRFSGLIAESGQGHGLIAVLRDKCLGCKDLVAELEVAGRPAGYPIAALVDTSDADFSTRVDQVFDLVVHDEDLERAVAVGIVATPYVLAVDEYLKIQHRGITGDLHGLAHEWFGSHSDTADEVEREPLVMGR